MSGSRKLVCGIAQKPKCRSCGKAIRLHPRDLLVLLPAAVIGAWWAVDPSTAASVALAGGFALYVVLHQAWVPFVAAE